MRTRHTHDTRTPNRHTHMQLTHTHTNCIHTHRNSHMHCNVYTHTVYINALQCIHTHRNTYTQSATHTHIHTHTANNHKLTYGFSNNIFSMVFVKFCFICELRTLTLWCRFLFCLTLSAYLPFGRPSFLSCILKIRTTFYLKYILSEKRQ